MATLHADTSSRSAATYRGSMVLFLTDTCPASQAAPNERPASLLILHSLVPAVAPLLPSRCRQQLLLLLRLLLGSG